MKNYLFDNSSIKNKLLVLLLATSILPMIFIVSYMFYQISTSINSLSTQDINYSKQQVENYIDVTIDSLTGSCEAQFLTSEILSAFKQRNHILLLRKLNPIFYALKGEKSLINVAFFDGEKRLFIDAAENERDFSQTEKYFNFANKNKTSIGGIEVYQDNKITFDIVLPILELNEITGYVKTSFSLDENFLTGIKNLTGDDIVIDRHNASILWTNKNITDIFNDRKNNRPITDYLFGEDLFKVSLPLKNIDGHNIADIYMFKDMKIFLNVKKNIIIISISIIILLIVSLIFISKAISSSFTKPLLAVSEKMTEISKSDNVNLDENIEIKTQDEIGTLVNSFNKIQEKVKSQINTIKSTYSSLIQQERLASIGTLMGGIAHNLKTPILTIASSSEVLEKFVEEYKMSIGDSTVTVEDHHEIANDMTVRIDRIKAQCTYMSDIITAVREQVSNNDVSQGKFALGDIINRVHILMKSELTTHNCELEFKYDLSGDVFIKGPMGSFIQILNNTIINSIHAYDDKGGKIDIMVTKENGKVIFQIKDSGKGIPLKIKEKLFNEMVTTKGKDGTGIGLYVSYSNIKANFGGDMHVESVENTGTTITIIVNEYIVK